MLQSLQRISALSTKYFHNHLRAAGLAAIVASFIVFTGVAQATVISQGYSAATDIAVGSVVSVSKDDSEQVEKSNTDNDYMLVGVVQDETGSLIDIQPKGSKVRVAISGDIKVLVSTINGDIKNGDRLIASPLSGIAAKEYPPAPGVKFVGVANQDFGAGSGGTKTTITQNDGSTRDVYVGVIDAKIITGNRTPGGKDQNVLTDVGKKLSGKSVNTVQVLAALVVFITSVVLTGMFLNGSIKGSFISLGRNPLSKDSIMTGLIRVII